MKSIFLQIQQCLSEVDGLRYINKDLRQLYSENPPVKWPCGGAFLNENGSTHVAAGHFSTKMSQLNLRRGISQCEMGQLKLRRGIS